MRDRREKIAALIYDTALRDRGRFISGTHVNQENVAGAMGISPSALSRYLADKRTWKLETTALREGLRRFTGSAKFLDLEVLIERHRPTPPPGAFGSK